MSESKQQLGQELPRKVALGDGRAVTLRLMTEKDADAVVAFARALPADDLLFLRTDITDPDVVEEWVQNIARERTETILAEGEGGGLAGYGSLHHHATAWTRHLGEIRLQVASAYRSRGLGRVLAGAVFDAARALGLKKLQASMTSDQRGARATFERLGFTMEALLQDYVIDREGRTRDMLIMSFDVEGFTDRGD